MTEPVVLHTLLADYPGTHALRSGEVSSPLIRFEFSPIKVANKGFKDFVRALRFDAGELAIATFLQAWEAGKPLVLLPATIVGRFQHGGIVFNRNRGALRPQDLAGKRIGVRAYTQTTGMWVRGILQNQYGVDPASVTWLTFEDAHVETYRNPPNVIIADADQKLDEMLLNGELDAAILGNDMPDDPRLQTVIPDPEAAALDWHRRNYSAIPVNHLAVVKRDLAESRPDVMAELFRVLKESKAKGGVRGAIDMRPFGLDNLRPGLELAIEYCLQQELIRTRPAIEDLFASTTIDLR